MEVTAAEAMDQRYTTRMGQLVAEAEKRCVAAEVERDLFMQRCEALSQEVVQLRAELDAVTQDASAEDADGAHE